MKKLRFLIAIVLIFSLLPVFSVAANEQADEIKATETYEFKKLEAFGLISESDPIFYYENVTRGTFLKYIMKTYPGYSTTPSMAGMENPFVDVDETTEGVAEILTAAYTGVISGAKNSEFRPSENITKSEAAKIFVSMIGYNGYAERLGGYPVGYLNVAEKLGLFSGCEFTPEGYFTITSFMKAYGNLLDTEVLELRSVSVNAEGEVVWETYKTLEERTLLYHTLGLFEATGIVATNEYASIYGSSDLDADEVEINGYVYNAKGTDAAALLGYNTHYYYKQGKDEFRGEIVYIEPYRTNVVDTRTKLIATSHVTDSNFRYYRDANSDKYYDVQISKSATLLYNGDLKVVTKEGLCPANGMITLIDNDDDKLYDVIIVMDYRTIIASSVNPLSYQVTDEFGGPTIELNPNAEDYDVKLEIKQPVSDSKQYNVDYELYGEYLPPVANEFASLKAGDVILYAESTTGNKKVKHVKVSRDLAKGTVTSIQKDGVIINDRKYEVGPVRVAKVVKDEENNDIIVVETRAFNVSLGEEGAFCLDIFGRIVSKSLDNKVVYGYLEDISKETKAFKSIVRVNIFSESDRWIELELAKSVKTNITESPLTFDYLSPDEMFEELEPNMDNMRQQLITYTVNKDGKVNNITVARSVQAYSSGEVEAMNEDAFRAVYDEEIWKNSASDVKITKDKSGKTLDTIYDFGKSFGFEDILLDDTTKIFVICGDNHEMTSILPTSQLSSNAGDFIAYDLNERRIAGALLLFRNDSTFTAGSTAPLVVVDEVIKTINSTGDLVSGFTGFVNCTPTVLVASSAVLDEKIASFNRGDVVQVSLNRNGEIHHLDGAIQRRFDISDETLTFKTTASTGDGSAEVYYVDLIGNRIILIGLDNKRKLMKVTSSTKYYMFDTEEGTISEATLADMGKGTRFYLKRSEATISQIIMYK